MIFCREGCITISISDGRAAKNLSQGSSEAKLVGAYNRTPPIRRIGMV